MHFVVAGPMTAALANALKNMVVIEQGFLIDWSHGASRPGQLALSCSAGNVTARTAGRIAWSEKYTGNILPIRLPNCGLLRFR